MDWTEFRIGNCALMILKRADADAGDGPATSVPWVFVEDLDAHFAHASMNGATIVEPIHKNGYRAYVADDPEGHRWTIAQARPTM
jgi:uncharacterized glyoxalase superfamily protein PhnB